MAKASQSQAGATSSGAPPRGSPAASGLRRRRAASGGGGGGGGYGGGGGNMLRFYTDDSPGLKITPTVVLVMSLCFISFVTALHVLGKLYQYRSGSA